MTRKRKSKSTNLMRFDQYLDKSFKEVWAENQRLEEKKEMMHDSLQYLNEQKSQMKLNSNSNNWTKNLSSKKKRHLSIGNG